MASWKLNNLGQGISHLFILQIIRQFSTTFREPCMTCGAKCAWLIWVIIKENNRELPTKASLFLIIAIKGETKIILGRLHNNSSSPR